MATPLQDAIIAAVRVTTDNAATERPPHAAREADLSALLAYASTLPSEAELDALLAALRQDPRQSEAGPPKQVAGRGVRRTPSHDAADTAGPAHAHGAPAKGGDMPACRVGLR